MVLKYKKLSNTAKTPTRGTPYSAGYDLYADMGEKIFIDPHTNKKINTGLALEIPIGYMGCVFARSGLASKENLRPANCTGVVDADYRGEVIVCLHNDSDDWRVINPGDRIAQIIFIPFAEADFQKVEELSDTSRGTGGFGSTG